MVETRKPFNVRFTESELKRIKDVSNDNGESTSSFIRRIVLNSIRE